MNGLKGFTLIELMIVVAIIGIMAAIAIPAYQSAVCDQDLVKCKVNMPEAYNRHLASEIRSGATKAPEVVTEQDLEEKLVDLTKRLAELANAKTEVKNMVPEITSMPIDPRHMPCQDSDLNGNCVTAQVRREVAKSYVFKRNDENTLTLKRHTITGALYACPKDGECTLVNE